jgi:hypothetical protein
MSGSQACLLQAGILTYSKIGMPLRKQSEGCPEIAHYNIEIIGCCVKRNIGDFEIHAEGNPGFQPTLE